MVYRTRFSRSFYKKHGYDFVYNSIRSKETTQIQKSGLGDILEGNNIEKSLEIMEERKYRLLYLNIKSGLNKKEIVVLKHLLKLLNVVGYKKLTNKLNVIALKNIIKSLY